MLLALVKSLAKPGTSQKESVDPDSDEALMFAYQEGDVSAFEKLVKRHEKPIFNFILRVGRQDLAEELLQEVFMRIVKSAPSYQRTAKFTTWAYTIARNICIDRARKHSKRKEYSYDQKVGGDEDGRSFLDSMPDTKATAATADYDRKVFLERLKEALAQLPEDQREVFVMREISGLKFREIADVLECPVPTIKSRMRYALESLRDIWLNTKVTVSMKKIN